jgi:hypothetical protein
MELSEKGYLPYTVRWGDGDMVVNLVRMIGYRAGIGDEMAEGSFRFAARYGHPELSMSAKKLEIPEGEKALETRFDNYVALYVSQRLDFGFLHVAPGLSQPEGQCDRILGRFGDRHSRNRLSFRRGESPGFQADHRSFSPLRYRTGIYYHLHSFKHREHGG